MKYRLELGELELKTYHITLCTSQDVLAFFYFFYFCNRRSNIDDTNVETKRIRIQLIIWNHIRIIIYNNNNMLCQSTHKQSDILLYIEILTNNIRNNAIKALYMLYQHDYMILGHKCYKS